MLEKRSSKFVIYFFLTTLLQLIGVSCLPPHADSRCCFTMMPIFMVPSHKCSFCHCVAHREVEKELSIFICPYCDVPMDKIPVDSKELESAAIQFDIDCQSGEVKSICHQDCLSKNSDEHFDDIENNDAEFIIFSDSDEETVDDRDKLKTLYIKMGQCSLEEIMAIDNEGVKVDEEDEPSKKLSKLEESGNEEQMGS